MQLKQLVEMLQELGLEDAQVFAGHEVDDTHAVTGIWVTTTGEDEVMQVVFATPSTAPPDGA